MSLYRDAELITEEDFDPFALGEIARVAKVTPEQQELWLSVELGGTAANLAYNQALALTLTGELDAVLLRRCLDELVERHEALRTTLSGDGTQLCVAASGSMPFEQSDLSVLDPAARARALEAARGRAADREFDLVKGPLVRCELLRLAEKVHVLIVVAHHVICDGTSLGILTNELAELYTARKQGVEPMLVPATPFCDYAELREREAGGSEAAADLAYWKNLYAVVPPELELPLDHARPPERTYAADRLDTPLDPSLVRSLKAQAAKRGTSFTTLLLAAFEAYLARITGQRSFALVLPGAGQIITGKRALVGHCVRTLPLYVELDPSTPFSAHLDRVKKSMLDALDHPRMTFGELVKALPIARDPSRIPLSGVAFNVDSNSAPTPFQGLATKVESLPRSNESFELFLSFAVLGDEVTIETCFCTTLFDRESIRQRVGELCELLRDIAASPDKPIAELELLSDEQRERLLESAGSGVPREPVTETACARILATMRRTPEKVAVRSGQRSLTYGELDRASAVLAHVLIERGVGPGSFVGVFLSRSVDLLVAILAISRSGGAYVPLDPEYPSERLAFIREDTRLELVVSERTLASRLPLGVTSVLVDEKRDGRADDVDRSDLESPAYVIYTSGSTGKPKGAIVRHRNLASTMATMRRRPGLGQSDVVLSTGSPCFDITVPDYFLTFMVGAELVVATSEEVVDGQKLGRLIADERVTWFQATPAGWRVLLESGWQGRPGLRGISAGEALSNELALELRRRVDQLWNGYGPTETTIYATFEQVGEPPITIGTPVEHARVYVLDANRRLLPQGVTGELYVGGAGVSLGYHNRPELTRERFFEDPFLKQPGARMYKTGDLGRLRRDGRVEWLGRNDFQVKIRGYRIELGEIEARLSACTGVREGVVLAREDRPGDQRIVGYVRPESGAPREEERVRDELRASLPPYMVPHHVVFLDEFPLNPSGKVDRSALPAPERAAENGHRAPETALQTKLAAAFAELLGLERVGVDDDFFARGGHSLLALRLVARLRASANVDVPVRVLFANPTVKGLSDYLEAALVMQRSSGVQSTDGREREELLL
jgi:amino acid adenylation domain-containing protein